MKAAASEPIGASNRLEAQAAQVSMIYHKPGRTSRRSLGKLWCCSFCAMDHQ
jgi:hypothetical protein